MPFIARFILAVCLFLTVTGPVSATWKIRGKVLAAGSMEPIGNALVLAEGRAGWGCNSDETGDFRFLSFGDTLCGTKINVTALGYKPTFFYIPWMNEDPSLWPTLTITVYMEPDPMILGKQFSALENEYYTRFRKKDSMTVSLRIWTSDTARVAKVFLSGSTADTITRFDPAFGSDLSARIACRKLRETSWEVLLQTPKGPYLHQVISLKKLPFPSHCDVVVDPGEPVKPADWQAYPYPEPVSARDGEIVPEPEPVVWINVSSRAEWPTGETGFFELLNHQCRDIHFRHAENWVMKIVIRKTGQMTVLPPAQPVRDTEAWEAVKQVLESGMPVSRPAIDQGRPVHDTFYLMLDTRALGN